MLGGSGGMLPREIFDKNGAIWCIFGVPKYVITILKINNFKVTKSTTTELNCHIFSGQCRCARYTKMIRFRTSKGFWGASPRSRRIF